MRRVTPLGGCIGGIRRSVFLDPVTCYKIRTKEKGRFQSRFLQLLQIKSTNNVKKKGGVESL